MNKLIIIGITLILIISLFGCTESKKEGFKTEDCENDCESLGQKYFKYNYSMGGYGPSIVQCWCVNDENVVQQVW